MKKILALVLALAMVFALAACGSTQAPAATAAPAAENSSAAPAEAPAEAGPSSIAVCLASEPDTLDPALNSAVDGATMLVHLFSGLAKWAEDANGALVIAPTQPKSWLRALRTRTAPSPTPTPCATA